MKQLRLLILLLLSFVAVTRVHAEGEATSLEYKVKAVVLVNFAKYVHWPEKTFATPTQPVRVCILGESPFGDVFKSSDAPKEAQNRPLEIVEIPRAAKPQDVSACQILYYQERDESLLGSLQATLKEHVVLTVADKKSDAALISFLLKDGKVRFKIRRTEAEALGLNISSQLLKLAILDE